MKFASVVDVVLQVVQVCALSVAGGFVYTASLSYPTKHGGWWNLQQLTLAETQLCSRAAIALSTGSLMTLVSRRRSLGLVVGLTTLFSLFIWMHSYQKMGRDVNSYLDSSGCFDWVLGRDEATVTGNVVDPYPFYRRWVRSMGGLGLHGLAWTVPGGYYIYHFGYGWQPALSGAAAGLLYNLGYICPSNVTFFSQGFELGGFFMGIWIWLVFLTSALSPYRNLKDYKFFEHEPENERARSVNSSDDVHEASVVERFMSIAFEVWCRFFSLVLLASIIFYSRVKQSFENEDIQTILGLCFSFAMLTSGQLVVVLKKYTGKDGTYTSPVTIISSSSFDVSKTSQFLQWLWPSRGVAPFVQMRAVIGWLSLGSTLLTVLLSLTSLFWNISNDRYTSEQNLITFVDDDMFLTTASPNDDGPTAAPLADFSHAIPVIVVATIAGSLFFVLAVFFLAANARSIKARGQAPSLNKGAFEF
eukprot:m.109585 g.109585  ORF g.109585 m.109585 type:complete len:473 (-) comp51775_c0_seq1:812-2230(-)